jgi:hypothetical protein
MPDLCPHNTNRAFPALFDSALDSSVLSICACFLFGGRVFGYPFQGVRGDEWTSRFRFEREKDAGSFSYLKMGYLSRVRGGGERENSALTRDSAVV